MSHIVTSHHTEAHDLCLCNSISEYICKFHCSLFSIIYWKEVLELISYFCLRIIKKIINARKLLKKNSKPLKSVRCFRGIPLRSPINGISYVSIFRDLEILPVARFTDIRRSKQLPILDRGIGKTLQTCGMSVKTKPNILYGQNLLHY